jgi:hypothetical protein
MFSITYFGNTLSLARPELRKTVGKGEKKKSEEQRVTGSCS